MSNEVSETELKLRASLSAAFARLSDPTGDLVHIANAKRANNADPYDGAAFISRAAEDSDEFFDLYDEALQVFRDRSTTKKP